MVPVRMRVVVPEIVHDPVHPVVLDMRPDIEAMPWGSIDTSGFAPQLLEAARHAASPQATAPPASTASAGTAGLR